MNEKTMIELIQEYVEIKAPEGATEEEKEQMIITRAMSLLRC
ncbi:MAG: hypothetical protein ACOWWR_12900 [Eubacteriales bacterium]